MTTRKTLMRVRFRAWKSLSSEHKDYLLVYSAALLWALTYLVFTPPSTSEFILERVVIVFWLGSTIVGAGLAIIGILSKNNLLLERLGVTFILATPVIYTLLQIGMIVYHLLVPEAYDSPWYARLNLVFLGLWLFFFLNKRRRQLKAKVKEAEQTPLPSESVVGEVQ